MKITESDLVSAARVGDQNAFQELVRLHNQAMFRIARSITTTDEDAEDALQEAYISAFMNIEGFREESRFKTWLSRITINAAQGIRRQEKFVAGYDTVAETENPGVNQRISFAHDRLEPEQSRSDANVRHALQTAVSLLKPELRTPWVMFDINGQSVYEIAMVLDISSVAVRTRVFRARRQLRKLLRERDVDLSLIFQFNGTRCERMVERVRLGIQVASQDQRL